MPSPANINDQINQLMRDALDLRAKGATVETVAAYSRAIALDDKAYATSRAYLLRGMARRELDDFAGALADYKQSLRLADFPLPFRVAAAHILSGAAELRLGRWKQAEKQFRQAYDLCLKTDNNDFELDFAVPWDMEAAARDITLYVDAYPTSTVALFCRGLVCRALKDAPRAVADFAAASANDPKNRRLHVWALTQEQLGYSISGAYQRPYLRPGTDYIALEYAMDAPALAYISRYDVDARANETASITDADRLRHQLERDGWLVLYRTNHKEGYSYLYWRAKGV